MNIHKVIDTYYDHPTLTKTQNSDEYSIYIAKNNSLLATTHRYIIAFVPHDTFFIGHQCSLSTLNWKVFQARLIPEQYKVSPYSYTPKKIHPYTSMIKKSEHTSEFTTYTCEQFPITISLLTNEQDLNIYPDQGLLNSALETYHTIIQLK